MSPPLKRSTRSTGKAPNIALLPNGKIPQAPKPEHKTQQHQSKDTDKDIKSEAPVPTPAAPRPIPSKKSGTLDEEDDEAFEEDIQVEKLQAQSAKVKKSKGKKSNVKGPFKSGPIPEQAKQCAFAIHANFKKQIQDLAAEISKAPQLLFSLVGEGPLLSHCALTQWGAFKAWYGVHGEIKKPKN
ncbi:hypothetical protein DXG01_010550, partial [Tephrocybe rancida]